jgi:hypothetical protein
LDQCVQIIDCRLGRPRVVDLAYIEPTRLQANNNRLVSRDLRRPEQLGIRVQVDPLDLGLVLAGPGSVALDEV